MPCPSPSSSSASTALPRGSPSSASTCSGRLCAWSKKAVGRPGNGVSVHAKLNSPKPTPSQGSRRISSSVLAQMPKRELDTSLPASRSAPPNTCADAAAHCAIPHHASAYISGAASSSTRVRPARRRSAAPHSASSSTLSRPVREAVSTTAQTNSASSGTARRRDSRPISTRAITAIDDHSSRLLRWLGWRRLPTARPGSPLSAIQLPSGQAGANTCTSAIAALARPAATQATQKAANSRGASAPRRAAAPLASSSAAAASNPSADSASDDGSAPGPQDHSTPRASAASAAATGHAARPGDAGAISASTTAHRPQSASASAWFK